MTTMTMSHPMKRTLSTMGLIILKIGATINSGDDCPSDDDVPDPQFVPAPNVNEKSTGYHYTTEEEYPTDNTRVGIKNETQKNTGVEIRNETQNNSKDED